MTANHFVDNPAAAKVLRKVGFAPTGEVRMRYSAGRGAEAPASRYAITLDCFGFEDGDDDMRAA